MTLTGRCPVESCGRVFVDAGEDDFHRHFLDEHVEYLGNVGIGGETLEEVRACDMSLTPDQIELLDELGWS